MKMKMLAALFVLMGASSVFAQKGVEEDRKSVV